jgi:mono/diheme cytochrome c family protein
MSRPAGPSFLAALIGMLLAGCDNMKHQENVRAFEPSVQFADGASARKPPAHTVARGDLAPDDPIATGRSQGGWVSDPPVAMTRGLLDRGQDRFNIFCADCHGEDGYGTGIVVRRGFPQPASFHEDRLRAEPAGLLFDAISRGSGVMYGFGDRISPGDRWAIVAYIRALQKSQDASLAELAPEDRRKLPLP